MPPKISVGTGHHLRFDWPLTGKLRTDVDPMLIGETNFRSLVNMRYRADCPRGILGMTKIFGFNETNINRSPDDLPGDGIDENTLLVLRFENNLVDSSFFNRTVYSDIESKYQYDNINCVFGSYSINVGWQTNNTFGTNGLYLDVDDTFKNFSNGKWAIDGRFYFNTFSPPESSNTGCYIYYMKTYIHETEKYGYMAIYVDVGGHVCLDLYNGVTYDLSLHSTNVLLLNKWYYISVEENENDYYIFVGTSGGLANIDSYISSQARVGKADTYALIGNFPEVNTKKIISYEITQKNSGINYTVGDILTVVQDGAENGTIKVKSVTNYGNISNVVATGSGNNYEINDTFTLKPRYNESSNGYGATLMVTEISEYHGLNAAIVLTGGSDYKGGYYLTEPITGIGKDASVLAYIDYTNTKIKTSSLNSGGSGYYLANNIPVTGGTGSGCLVNITEVSKFGASFSGKMDELRISDINRHTEPFPVPPKPYSPPTPPDPIISGSIENGFHFKENSPYESNILVQVTPTEEQTNSTLCISNNTNKIPNPDTFSGFKKLSNTKMVMFSSAPDGAMVATNGTDSLIWGGGESKISYYVNFDKYPEPTFWYNYTDVVNNTLDDEQNVAFFRHSSGNSGNDIHTLLLLHCDSLPITDSSQYSRPITSTLGITLAPTLNKAFGSSYSLTPDAIYDYIKIDDVLGFDFSGGSWMIDFWIEIDIEQQLVSTLFNMSDNNGNSVVISIDPVTMALKFDVKENNETIISLIDNKSIMSQWHYIAIGQRENEFYMFVGHPGGVATKVQSINTSKRIPIMIGPVTVTIASGFDGRIDEFRVSNVFRFDGQISVPLLPYSTNQSLEGCKVLIASTRPIKGAKWYVKNKNNIADSYVSVSYWDGSKFSRVSNIIDGTYSNATTLSQTGSISFDSTLNVAKLRVIHDVLAFFYEFTFINISLETTIYSVTIDYEIQQVTDLWNGNFRSVIRAWFYENSLLDTPKDITSNVYTIDYNTESPYTYADIGGMTQSGRIVYGSFVRLIGIYFSFPDPDHVNENVVSIKVDYYDGSGWTEVGSLVDGTSSDGKTLNHSGYITWDIIDKSDEFKTVISNKSELYYYGIRIYSDVESVVLGDARLDYICGIETPVQIHPFRFSLMWQNRLWLCNDPYQNPNRILCSSYSTNIVFNGEDSGVLTFGDDEELVCGSTLYSRFGSNIYDNMVVFKKNATYLVDGTSIDTWTKYTVSDSIGCIAPLTLKKCDMSYEVSQGITKHILVWRSSRGIEFFDGNSLSPVSDDIGNLFDPSSREYIDPQIYDTENETSFYDDIYYEYHWIFTNIDGLREFVYNLKYKKWYEISRGIGKELTCGFTVIDEVGNKYIYGGTKSGCIERLENGTTFDGNPIVCTLWTGDIEIIKSGNYVTKLRNLKLFARSKTSEALVAITHYADAEDVGTELQTITQTNTGSRLYQTKCPVNMDAVLHGLKYSVTTDNEKSGFEPFMISGLFIVGREDII
jgi:hypothetical protein